MEWDLVIEIKEGTSVYALPEITFTEPGEYVVVLSGEEFSLEQILVVKE
jgi:hypothetical protein